MADEEPETSEATPCVAMDWEEDVAELTVAEREEDEDDKPLLSIESECNRFRMDLAPYDQKRSIPVPLIPMKKIVVEHEDEDRMTGLDVQRSSLKRHAKREKMEEIFKNEIEMMKGKGKEVEETKLEASPDEDAVIGVVIIVVGNSQKAKNRKNKKKRNQPNSLDLEE